MNPESNKFNIGEPMERNIIFMEKVYTLYTDVIYSLKMVNNQLNTNLDKKEKPIGPDVKF